MHPYLREQLASEHRADLLRQAAAWQTARPGGRLAVPLASRSALPHASTGPGRPSPACPRREALEYPRGFPLTGVRRGQCRRRPGRPFR